MLSNEPEYIRPSDNNLNWSSKARRVLHNADVVIDRYVAKPTHLALKSIFFVLFILTINLPFLILILTIHISSLFLDLLIVFPYGLFVIYITQKATNWYDKIIEKMGSMSSTFFLKLKRVLVNISSFLVNIFVLIPLQYLGKLLVLTTVVAILHIPFIGLISFINAIDYRPLWVYLGIGSLYLITLGIIMTKSQEIYRFIVTKASTIKISRLFKISPLMGTLPVRGFHNANYDNLSCCDITISKGQYYCNTCGRAVVDSNTNSPNMVYQANSHL